MREGWKEVKLGDILEIKHGHGFKGEFFKEYETDNVLVTPGNFNIGGGFKNEKLKYYDGPISEDFILKPNDVIVTMTDLSKMADTIGYSAKVPASSKTYLHNQRIGLIKLLTDEVDIDFIYWFLRTSNYQRYVAGSSTGATVKHTSPSKIYSYIGVIPPLETQKKIASILSGYDDLIENNLKRIKILEEMAQQTYEEWFVRMRFPGHESATINPETGLPEGWEKVKLGEMCNITMGQSPKSEYYNDTGDGLPFHQGVKDYGFRFPINKSWSTQGNKVAKAGSVLFSVRAPVGRINVASEEIILGRGLAAISHKKELNSFLLYQLKNIFFEDNMIGGGAIYASVTKNDMERIEVIFCDNYAQKFNSYAHNIDQSILNLTLQNQRLREARDVLLPRLMMGMIEV